MNIHWLNDNPTAAFPDVEQAFSEPDGLLAAGGDLTPERLINAYQHGIFPWYNPGEPILWWSPNPRCVLFPEQIKISKSLKRTLKKNIFEIRFDTAFADVMNACAEPRPNQEGTWISDEMFQAYLKMHHLGYAHSVECWQDGELVGGLYGMALDKVFFGESMFSRVSDASKVALVYLCESLVSKGFKLIDSQVHTPHLERLGAQMISRERFIQILQSNISSSPAAQQWR